ncbi:hypothetical protein EFBL_3512 [Effusibacillus lacus]|uniref:protein acetyllysine N-acetyltransferase n=1 Tax=Effusibacillus lacus TaxID=1348429 RepID=A0A292YSC8_9BACL|nr:hypothetical protein EFBL_3512 [Effusibacillus lacus]
MISRDALEVWKRQVAGSFHPIAVTGAGISVPSGLPTVSADWKGIPLREFFTLDMFLRETERFYQYYRHILQHWTHARPNQAHYSLAKKGIPVITQNIDGLHSMAGSRHVLELHGNLLELVCTNCRSIYSSQLAYRQKLPQCASCRGLLKPNIVLVGEEVYHYGTAVDWVGRADLLLIVGTRLEMAPCNELLEIAKRNGAAIIRINRRAEVILPQILSGSSSE